MQAKNRLHDCRWQNFHRASTDDHAGHVRRGNPGGETARVDVISVNPCFWG